MKDAKTKGPDVWNKGKTITQHGVEVEGEACFVIVFTMDEADVKTVMAHPTTMIGSDGVPAGGKPHPRLYGCFARVLGLNQCGERLFETRLQPSLHQSLKPGEREFLVLQLLGE